MLVNKIKIFFKDSGFSLLETAVTVGLMGFVSLFTMKLMEQQNMSQLSIEASSEINMTVSTIAQAINDPEKCASMFKGKNLTPQSPPTRISTTLPGLIYQVKRGASLVNVNLLQTLSNHNKVYKQFYIKDASSIELASETGSSVANLNLTFHVQPIGKTQKMALSFNPFVKTVKRSIPFNVKLNGSTVMSCGPVISSHDLIARKNACEMLSTTIGATWDNATNKCVVGSKVVSRCYLGELPVGFDSAGRIICEPATNRVRVEDIFDLNATANCTGSLYWYIDKGTSGKLVIKCTATEPQILYY